MSPITLHQLMTFLWRFEPKICENLRTEMEMCVCLSMHIPQPQKNYTMNKSKIINQTKLLFKIINTLRLGSESCGGEDHSMAKFRQMIQIYLAKTCFVPQVSNQQKTINKIKFIYDSKNTLVCRCNTGVLWVWVMH